MGNKAMQWKLLLEAAKVNSKMIEIEENLTAATDKLMILEAEAEKMAYYWEGASRVQWIKSFRTELLRVKQYVHTSGEQEVLLKQLACELAKLEQSTEAVVEAM